MVMDTKSSWMISTALLCLCGVFNYMKFSEPFLTPYLMGPHHNLTETEVVNSVFPVWTYSYMAALVPVFILTDYVKYKPVIFVQGIGYISCYLLLCFASGVSMMQLMQCFYGVATAAEIGYYSYIYNVVDEKHYQKVTSYVRGSTLMGMFFSSVLSQLLVSNAQVEFFYLNIITLVNVSIAFVISWFLPMPKQTFIFYLKDDEVKSNQNNLTDSIHELESLQSFQREDAKIDKNLSKWREVAHSIFQDLKVCYTNPVLLRWSIWWALSTSGWILVVSYVQNLWETIRPSSNEEIYNGAVESIATVFGASGAILVGYIKLSWSKWGELILGIGSFLKFGLLLLMYLAENIWICYAGYICFIALYHMIITVTQYQLSVGLTNQRFALVLGLNTFAAVVLNTILTVIFIDDAVLGLNVTTQFLMYSIYYGIIAIVFLCHGCYAIFTDSGQNNNKSSVCTEETHEQALNI